MKKIYWLICLLIIGITHGWAQTYTLEYDIDFGKARTLHRNYLDFFIITYDAANQKMGEFRIPGLNLYRQTGSENRNGKIDTLKLSNYKTFAFKVETSTQKYKLLGWDTMCEMDPENPIISKVRYFNNDKLLFWGCIGFHGSFNQKKMLLYANCAPVIDPEEINYQLPSDDEITLSATPGFPDDVYRWYYRLNNGLTWIPVPDHLRNQNKLHLSAKDLFGNSWETHLSDKVHFGIDLSYDQTKISDKVSYTVTLSTPKISSIGTTPNKCNGETKGVLKVNFARQLRTSESLKITLYKKAKGEWGVERSAIELTQLQQGNSYTFIDLNAGEYRVHTQGLYKDVPTFSRSREQTLTDPKKVNFAIDSTANILCYGDAGGMITISATGGTGSHSFLYKAPFQGSYQSVPFSAPGKHIQDNLYANTYELYVTDANGCFMKDSREEKVILKQPVTQPKPLEIDFRNLVSPTAYGYTDGAIEVIVKGGTTFDDQSYQLQWTAQSGAALPYIENEPRSSGYYSRLDSLGDGTYYLQVTDSLHQLAPAGHQAGCRLTEPFTLIQPPPLTAEIHQHYRISCHGYGDGALYAQAQGGIPIPVQRYYYQWYKAHNGSWELMIGQTDSIALSLSAGTYRVSVTDKNDITRYASSFTLTQPDPLKIEMQPTYVACNGGNDGTISATISGGTSPYHYEWSTGDTVNLHIGALYAGRYFLSAEDSLGCTSEQQALVSERDPITYNDTIVQSPTCTGMADGFISFTLGGGQAPYTTQWSNGATTRDIQNLTAGIYQLQVTDSKGCGWTKTFTLSDPPPVPLALGDDRTLCDGQTWIADATVPTGVSYQWNGSNGFTATTPQVDLGEAGTYNVTAVTAAGCTGHDTITIYTSPMPISAIFAASTQAYANEPVVFVNISKPAPDAIHWIIPEEAQTLSSGNDMLELLFARPGIYDVGVRTNVGACEKIYLQQITIVENTQLPIPDPEQIPFILDFYVAPNPSGGTFTAHIELREESNIRLRIINIASGQIVDDRKINNQKTYDIAYNLSLPPGIYALMLETGGEKRTFKIVMNDER